MRAKQLGAIIDLGPFSLEEISDLLDVINGYQIERSRISYWYDRINQQANAALPTERCKWCREDCLRGSAWFELAPLVLCSPRCARSKFEQLEREGLPEPLGLRKALEEHYGF